MNAVRAQLLCHRSPFPPRWWPHGQTLLWSADVTQSREGGSVILPKWVRDETLPGCIMA